ncbi:hypothetical protein [Sorangium sp. So ce1153]|uniref:hypothetical protein n=1 Tax=Sorangium sp. So ce1153 TaxID=3133333 RepID=UPI003F5DE4D2
MRLTRCLGLALLLCASGWSRGALAEALQSPGTGTGGSPSTVSPSGASRSAAAPAGVSSATTVETLRRAEQARRAGRWEDAAAAYRAAWESTGDPRWAGELGLAELALRRYRDAAEHLRRALDAGDALAPGVRARFQQGLERAAHEVAAVAIVVGKPEAEVFMDGRRVGQGLATYVVYVEPGGHEARAALHGHEDGVGRFEALRGDTPAIGLALKEKPPASRPAAPPRAAAAAPGSAALRPATGGTRASWRAVWWARRRSRRSGGRPRRTTAAASAWSRRRRRKAALSGSKARGDGPASRRSSDEAVRCSANSGGAGWHGRCGDRGGERLRGRRRV